MTATMAEAGATLTPPASSFLARVPADLRVAWSPHLRPVRLAARGPIYDPKAPVRQVTFPVDCVVAVVSSAPNGATAMMAMVGHEGFIGLPAVMSGHVLKSTGVVLLEGDALRLPSHFVTDAFNTREDFRRLVMCYIQAFIVQAGQLSLCNRHCAPEGQLATMLLRAMDRKGSSELKVTHEGLSSVLGWRRETVSQASHRLLERGALSYRRGHVSIPSRASLERAACTCYAALQDSYDEIWTAPRWTGPEPRRDRHEHSHGATATCP
jgi:CRP-like cAMP-binding protein